MATVPSTKKKLQSALVNLTGAQDQGIMRANTTIATTTAREDMYLLRDVSVDGFRKLKRDHVAKPGEVVVASYPKSGTTWMQNIVSLIKNNGVDDGEDLDDKWLWIEQFPPAEVEVTIKHALIC